MVTDWLVSLDGMPNIDDDAVASAIGMLAYEGVTCQADQLANGAADVGSAFAVVIPPAGTIIWEEWLEPNGSPGAGYKASNEATAPPGFESRSRAVPPVATGIESNTL